MLTIAYPWLLLLIPLPILIRLTFGSYHQARAAVKVPFFSRLLKIYGQDEGSVNPSAPTKKSHTVLMAVCWILILVALARPQYIESPISKTIPTRDMLLAVDLSGSMEAADFTNSEGQKVDRLMAVKEVLDEFLARREGDRVGLIVFGNAAFVQVPFTQDLEACRILLNETAVRMAGPKTAFGDAIGLGITLFEQSEVEDRVIIALTDGNDTGSRVSPADAAQIAADNEITIHTVGIGDPSTLGEEKLDEEALETVARATGGRYFHANSREELAAIYDELDKIEVKKVENQSYRPRLDLFYWPLAAMLVLTMGFHLLRLFAGKRENR